MSYKAQLIELRRHPYHAFRPPHSRKAWKPWKPRKPNKRIVFRCFFEISFCFYSALCFISATFLILFLFLSLFADVFASAADASYKCILVSSPLSPFHCHYPNTAIACRTHVEPSKCFTKIANKCIYLCRDNFRLATFAKIPRGWAGVVVSVVETEIPTKNSCLCLEIFG